VSIADALRRFTALPRRSREQMGRDARRKAESLFAADRILDSYEQVIFGTGWSKVVSA
jgi:hypothetical protein